MIQPLPDRISFKTAQVIGVAVIYCLLVLVITTPASPSTLAMAPRSIETVNADDVKTAQLLKPTLRIEANVYYGDEDEEKKPVAGTAFYLLDESFAAILQKADFSIELPDQPEAKPTDEDYLTAAAKSLDAGDDADDETFIINLFIRKELTEHGKLMFDTGYDGRAFSNSKQLRAGSYYLFGIGRTENEILVWNLPVQIRAGANVIELDQHNAQVIFSD